VFDITVENTSTINSELRGFSFETPLVGGPDAINGSVSGSLVFDTMSVDLSPPGGEVDDVCVVTNGNLSNCNGVPGSDDGLDDEEAADTLTLSLIYSGNVSAGINLTNFCGRFQSVGANSQDSDKACSTGENFTPVPEPGSLALLGAGIASLAARRARKRRVEV
jgi:hypothetical protein